MERSDINLRQSIQQENIISWWRLITLSESFSLFLLFSKRTRNKFIVVNFHHQDDHELRWLWIFSHERRWRTVMLVWWPFLLLYLCRRTFCFIVIYLRLFDCFTHKKRCLICDSKNNCFLTKSKVTLIPFTAILVFFFQIIFRIVGWFGG